MSKRYATQLGVVLFSAIWIGILFSQEQGYVLEEESITPPVFGIPGTSGIIKTWIIHDKVRKDEVNKEQTTIIRTDLGKVWIINHADTTYHEMSRETFQGLAIMGLMVFGVTVDTLTGKPIVPNPMFRRTERMRKVEDWNCFEMVRAKEAEGFFGEMVQHFSMWISRNTGLDQSLYSRLLRQMMGDLGKEYNDFFKQLSAIGGYPVLVETQIMGAIISQQLKKVKVESLPSSIFELPEGYQKVDAFE